ncbi:DUF6603 domain-containing protein [Streptomyces sp. NPDC086766]|uniref:DUF6603 domain-containing protein n=1 Tax=Streptomyces sp. NPDC086766 TaxID=3365754 RepID=UPI00380B761D
MTRTTFQQTVESIGQVIAASTAAMQDAQIVESVLNQLGWETPPGTDLASLVTLDAGDVITKLKIVTASTDEEREDELLMAGRYADLLLAVQDYIAQITTFSQSLPGVLSSAGDWVEKTGIVHELPRRLLDFAVVAGVTTASPRTASVLRLLGIFPQSHHEADHSIYQVEHFRAVVDYEQIGALLTGPGTALAAEYGWGRPEFDSSRLLENLGLLVQGFGGRGVVSELPERIDAQIGNAPTATDAAPTPQLLVELLHSYGWVIGEAGLSLHRLRATTTEGTDVGIELSPYIRGSAELEIPLFGPLSLVIDTDIDLSQGIGIAVRPTGVQLRGGLLQGDAEDLTGSLAIGLKVADPDGTRHQLLSAGGGTQLSFQEAYAQVGGRVGAEGPPDAFVRAGLIGCRLEVTTGSADGFLKAVIPDGLSAEFDLRLLWSKLHGLSFEGSGQLDLTIPVHQTLGPITLDALRLRLGVGSGAISLTAGASGSLELGPLHANVENIGLRTKLTPSPGNLGPVGLELGFKPPDGAGLSIDGPVTGGGYLFFDEEREQYAGVLHLQFGQINLNAFGLLTTRMPDGESGFSLLALVQATGFTPVQLGFGFTLTGIGGLLGINRTVAVDALRAGVRTHALDSIMFMRDDPVPRAPQIISTLQSVFPPARDRHLFGPMVQLAWGTPTLVTAEIALILELPSPLRLIVLGRLRALLPTPETAVVKLQLDAVGVLDFGRREVSVDASLVDSTVGPFALSGDMALRASWGEQPDFALSIGGFHPSYTPPAGFPSLRRLTLALSNSDNPRLRAECYLAITANTVQVGAALEVRVAAAGFALEGGMGFDALMNLSPFGFQVDIAAYLVLKRGSKALMGIDLRAHLTGPDPWHLQGEVTFKILFVKVTIGVDATFGDSRELPSAQRESIWPQLRAALESAGNWAAELPADSGRLATLKPPVPAAGEAIVHPLGAVRVSQRIVPLQREIARFGAAPPADFTRFEIVSATGARHDPVPVYDSFSPGQYLGLSDAEKLAAPGFEQMPSGARLTEPGDAHSTGPGTACPITFETITIGGRAWGAPFRPDDATVAQQAAQGAAADAATRSTGRLKYGVDAEQPKVADPSYVVAPVTDLSAPATDTDGSFSAAREAARERKDTQIVRREELMSA